MIAALLAKAGGFLAGVWGKVALAAAIVAGVTLLFLKVQHGGRVIERAEQREKINEAVRQKSKRDAGTRSLPDDELRRSVREQRDELRRLLQSR